MASRPYTFNFNAQKQPTTLVEVLLSKKQIVIVRILSNSSELREEGRLTRRTKFYPALDRAPEFTFSRGDKLEIVHMVKADGNWVATEARPVELLPRVHGIGVIHTVALRTDDPANNFAPWSKAFIRNPDVSDSIYCLPSNFPETNTVKQIRSGDIVKFEAAQNEQSVAAKETRFQHTATNVTKVPQEDLEYAIGWNTIPPRMQSLNTFITLWTTVLYNELFTQKEDARHNQISDLTLTWTGDLPLTATFTAPLRFRASTGKELKVAIQRLQFEAKCTIAHVEYNNDAESVITVVFRSTVSADIHRRRLQEEKFDISHFIDPTTFNLYSNMLKKIPMLVNGHDTCKQKLKIVEQLLGLTRNLIQQPSIHIAAEELCTPGLPDFKPNPQQLKVASAVFSPDDFPIVLVQASPGTGKTVLAASIINALAKSDEENEILVVAPTNRATDNIGQLLHQIAEAEQNEKVRPLRLYAKMKEQYDSDDPCQKYSVHQLALDATAPPDIEELRADLQKTQEKLDKVTLLDKTRHESNKAAIDIAAYTKTIDDLTTELHNWIISNYSTSTILTTCASAMDIRLERKSYTHVLVDESAAASMIDALMTTTRLDDQKTRQLILIGDVKQLKCFSCAAGEAREIASTSAPRFLQEYDLVPSIELDHCYRMHPHLLEFSSLYFYNDHIKSAVELKDRSLMKECFPWPLKDTPLLFNALDSVDHKAGNNSRANIAEVEAVIQFFCFLLSHCELQLEQIAILTFYEAQRIYLVNSITEEISAEAAKRVFVLDSFQGRECDVVILSTVRASEDDEGDIGFLKAPERLNVALTRAKHGLIILGHPPTLSKDPVWCDLLHYYSDWNLLHKDFHQIVGLYKPYPLELWYDDNGNLSIL